MWVSIYVSYYVSRTFYSPPVVKHVFVVHHVVLYWYVVNIGLPSARRPQALLQKMACVRVCVNQKQTDITYPSTSSARSNSALADVTLSPYQVPGIRERQHKTPLTTNARYNTGI